MAKIKVTEDKSNESTKPLKRRKSTKGALIKGMSKLLPAEMLDDPSFEQGLKDIMKGYSGVYAPYRRNNLYYIGLTRNLHGRIRRHREDRHANKWDSFIIFRIKRVDYLKDVETLLIRIADPPGNISKGNVPRDANLNRVLREIYRERKRSLRRVEKALK